MIKNYIEKANFEDTGFSYTLSLISGKHKMVILYCLMEFEVVRFNELKRYLKNVSDKTLSNNLKELEVDRLIIRREYPQIPPKVEYSLSERGKSLMEVLDQLCVWGEKNREKYWTDQFQYNHYCIQAVAESGKSQKDLLLFLCPKWGEKS